MQIKNETIRKQNDYLFCTLKNDKKNTAYPWGFNQQKVNQ